MKSMKKSRKLTINRETVRELTTEELKDAAGGAVEQLTGYYPSINAPCISVRVCVA